MQYWTADSRFLAVICQEVLWIFWAALSRISGPEAMTFGQQSAHETFEAKLTWKAIQHVFQHYCSLSPAKLEAHDSDHNSLDAYENAIWGGFKNLTKFMPIHMTCYPVIGKTNKQTACFDMIQSWQITLITTYHSAVFAHHSIPCPRMFLGNESQVSWDSVSSFFSFFNRHSVSLFLAQHHPNSQR